MASSIAILAMITSSVIRTLLAISRAMAKRTLSLCRYSNSFVCIIYCVRRGNAFRIIPSCLLPSYKPRGCRLSGSLCHRATLRLVWFPVFTNPKSDSPQSACEAALSGSIVDPRREGIFLRRATRVILATVGLHFRQNVLQSLMRAHILHVRRPSAPQTAQAFSADARLRLHNSSQQATGIEIVMGPEYKFQIPLETVPVDTHYGT